jgi:hypothetical protein
MAANHDKSSLGYSNLEAVNAHTTHPNPQQSDGLELAPEGYHYDYSYGHKKPEQNGRPLFDCCGRPIPYPQPEGKIVVAYDPPEVIETEKGPQPLPPPKQPTICGIRRKMFWVVIGAVAAFVVIAAAVGGGVGGSFAIRKAEGFGEATKNSPGNPAENSTTTGSPSPISPLFQNLSVAAVHWVDNSSVSHYNVYTQSIISSQVRILESSWDSEGQSWSVSPITDAGDGFVKAGTPIAASTGYPHTNKSMELVRDPFVLQFIVHPDEGLTLSPRSKPSSLSSPAAA